MPRVFVLGSGGWVPTLSRQTSCYLLETRRALVFFDCGTGLSRLHDPMLRELIARHRRVIVLLSHWHHDHVAGLAYLPLFFPGHEVVLGAPSARITGFAAADALGRYGGKPMLHRPLPDWSGRFASWRVQELDPGTNDVFGEKVEVIAQPHSDPSAGYRVRDVVYLTDTCERPESAAFAAKASLLIHDAWLDRAGTREDPDELAWHGTAEGAARIAAQARVSDLLLAHLNPKYDAPRLDRLLFEASAIFPRALLAADMMVIKTAGAEEEAPAGGGSAAEAGVAAPAGAGGSSEDQEGS